MNRKVSVEEFKKRCNEMYNNFYDYSKITELNGLKSKVIVKCPLHGNFEIAAYHHLEGMGCKECRNEKQKNVNWQHEAEIIHNSKYNYSQYKYVNSKTKSTIICPIHGEFLMSMNTHIHGKQGCPKCGKVNAKGKLSLTKERFIDKSQALYGIKAFDYGLVQYVNNKTPIQLRCEKCGREFWQRPDNHLNGHGCPYCPKIISKWEQEIVDFLKALNIDVEQNNRKILDGLEIDIFLPKYNIGIECDGLYWHSELFKDSNYHLHKLEECKTKGVRLIHIFEDEWENKQDIIKSIILNILNKVPNHINAKECIIKKIEKKTAKQFLLLNHLQGFIDSMYNYGLFKNDELVSVMGFNFLDKFKEYELVNFSNKINYKVQNGLETLFNYFLTDLKPLKILSKCDRRIDDGEFLKNLGFEFSYNSKPNCFEIIGKHRKQEKIIAFQDNRYRIFDCGDAVYELKNNLI